MPAITDTIGSETLISVDALGGDVVVPLPAAGGFNARRLVVVKKVDASANRVYIRPSDGAKIDGLEEWVLRLPREAVELACGTGLVWRVLGSYSREETLSRGAAIAAPAGLSQGTILMVWRAPFACRVTNVRGYRSGGYGATVNARRNGSVTHLGAHLSLATAGDWVDGGVVQNAEYAVGDRLEIMIPSVSGGPTQVAVQVDFSRRL